MKAIVCSSILLLCLLLSPTNAFADTSLPSQDRMLSCDPAMAAAAAQKILNDPKSIADPTSMFMPALTLFRNGSKDEALFWFFAAQLRSRYQSVFASRCAPIQP